MAVFDTSPFTIIYERSGTEYRRVGVTYLNMPNSSLNNTRTELENSGAIIKRILVGDDVWDADSSE